jgi:hypothetical protein
MCSTLRCLSPPFNTKCVPAFSFIGAQNTVLIPTFFFSSTIPTPTNTTNKAASNGWGEEDKGDPVGDFLVGLGLTEDGGAHEGGEEALKQIRTLLAPFVLRRVKTQVWVDLEYASRL